jgi:hypothetical protein
MFRKGPKTKKDPESGNSAPCSSIYGARMDSLGPPGALFPFQVGIPIVIDISVRAGERCVAVCHHNLRTEYVAHCKNLDFS